MFLFILIILAAAGSLFMVLGWRIWKKAQITLIHDYHYTKVKETDQKPYTEKMGKAMLLMGIGMVTTGILYFISHASYSWIVLGVCFVGGLIMMVLAQIKYNHGIF